MDKGKKRQRNVNFSCEETEKLVSLVEVYKNEIENKKSDAVTWQKKEEAWKAVEEDFNNSGVGVFRDAKHLKLKYEALKRDLRKKCNNIHAERYKTGGGARETSLLTPVERKVKEIISLSIEMCDSTYDSEHLEVVENASGKTLGLAEATDQPVPMEGPLTDTDTAECPSNLVSETPRNSSNERLLEEGNPHQPNTTRDSTPNSTKQLDQNIIETPPKKWANWQPISLKSRKQFALCKPREKRPFDKLTETKLDIAIMQKKVIEAELEEKLLKNQMLKNEFQLKNELYKLEKQEMLLKIEIVKIELQNKKKLLY